MKTTTEALSALKDIITAMSTDDRQPRVRSPIIRRDNREQFFHRRDNRERSPIRRDNREQLFHRRERSPIRRDNREQLFHRRERSPNRHSMPTKKIFRRKEKDLLKIVLKKTTAVPSVKSPPHSHPSPSYSPTSPIWIPESIVSTEEPVCGEAILGSVIGWEPCV